MFSLARSAALLAALAWPATAIAQDTGKGFLFGAPSGSVTFSGGWALASAHSDLFDFTTNELTLNKRDFSSPTGGVDFAFNLAPRTQLVVSGGYSGMKKGSAFRELIDNNDKLIEQTTNFRRVPVTATLKQYLTSPGRSIGTLAWIPARVAPYVGAGGGFEYYRFEQRGDFVDESMNVFNSTYSSDGWAPVAHGVAGFDYTLTPRFAITTEGRYQWSKASLSRDFSGFQHLDLSGFTTTVGFTIRY